MKRQIQRFLILVVLIFSVSQNCCAQKVPLSVEVDISSSMNRSGGPIPLTIHTHYFGSKAGLAGNLNLNLITTSGTLMATYQFDGMFLTRGEQTFQFLIQPPTSGVWEEAFDLFPVFQTDSGQIYQLQEQLLRLPGANRRSCVITVGSNSSDILEKDAKQLTAELAFEKRMPGFEDIRPSARPIVTLFRAVSTQDFPTQPLDHCASDIVVLPDDSFARLSSKQCAALLAWVKAGGSVAIFLDEAESIKSSRMEFLNELLDAPQGDPLAYQLSSGKLQFSENDEARLLLRKNGLGRVALAASLKDQSLTQGLGDANARQLYIHLWKVRREQQREILASKDGQWSFTPGKRYTVMNNPNFGHMNDPGLDSFARRFRPTPTSGGNGLLMQTLPMGMEMLPLWLIGVTLFFYVLAIGPGDYLLLGTLGLRKYTWIFFPIVTVLFTGGAIVAANYKMRGNDDGGRVLIRDISSDGHIVRENEISTYVPTTGGQKLVSAKRELLTPIEPQRLGVNYQYTQQNGLEFGESPPVFRGRFPVEAQLVQKTYKWSPEMVRRLRIPAEPTPEDSGFDWKQTLDPFDADQRLQLTMRLTQTFGHDVNAELIRRSGREMSHQPAAQKGEKVDRFVLCGAHDVLVDDYLHNYQTRQVVGPNGMVTFQDGYERGAGFLTSSALREEAGMYSVVSRLSPKCDDFLEDLPVLDPTSDKQWLLIVTVQNGNEWEVYRQLLQTTQGSNN